jgi:hypothetical protein
MTYPPNTTSLTFYVAVCLAWATAFALMVLLVSPAHAAVHGCPLCLSRAAFAALCVLSATAGGCIGFTAAALFCAAGSDR